MFSFENIYRQYLLCRKNKRNTANALRFERHQEENLLLLREELVSHTYRPARSVCFFAVRPKLREVFAADFRDRIVHHVLVNHLEKIWEPIFIHDSYACRRGKGIHRGVLRLREFTRKVTANGTLPAWYMQLDIQNYFMSIDKEILFALLAPGLRDKDALWLTRLLVFHDCTDNFTLKGTTNLREKIPPHKTLFGAPKGVGLPIGNLNSQFFANVYLNGLDQFVKHHLKCRFYLRYCDDFVLLSPSKEELLHWRARIEAYLANDLALDLNERRARLQPVSNGIDFLGYIVRPAYLLVRRRVVNNLRCRLQQYEEALVRETRLYRRYLFDEAVLDRLAATLASYLGHFKMANTGNLCRALWQRYPFLIQYFALGCGGAGFTRKYHCPKASRKIRWQYRYFKRKFRLDVLFFQVGRFFEFYEQSDIKTANLLDLAPMGENHRGARYGFPTELMACYRDRLLQIKQPVTVILEREPMLTRIKQRALAYRYEPINNPAHANEICQSIEHAS